jgi:sec-independent protein translocase protein TatA|tara:strand:+ start:259 stop:450 length:192 start_codon:yes stop_codon:yes gene_type:complete
MFPGFWQIAIVVVLVVLLFGRGKISSLMGDVAKGIKSFKKGLSDEPPSDKVDNVDDQDNSNKN